MCQRKLTMQMQGLEEWQTAEWVQISSTVVQRLVLKKANTVNFIIFRHKIYNYTVRRKAESSPKILHKMWEPDMSIERKKNPV